MSRSVAASHIAAAACSLHLSRACASDWMTTSVEMPLPPPSAISDGKDGTAHRLAISSRITAKGGSSRPPGCFDARCRAVSVTSSRSAAMKAAEAPAPAPVPSR
jgi:hypothetical protein